MTFNRPGLVVGLFAFALISVLFTAEMRAGENPAASPGLNPTIVSTDEATVSELTRLGQFFDVNAKVEQDVRENIEKLEDDAFLKMNKEVASLFKKNPRALQVLKKESRFLLYRELARMARAPLLRRDIQQFDTFLARRPEIAGPLLRKPSLLWDSRFMVAHPELGGFLEQHPGLSTILLEGSQPGRKGGAGKKAAK